MKCSYLWKSLNFCFQEVWKAKGESREELLIKAQWFHL